MKSLKESFIATSNIPLAVSAYHDEPLSLLFNLCKGGLQGLCRPFLYGDRIIRMQPNSFAIVEW